MEVKNLYSEKCKSLMKEFEEDTNKWKDSLCSLIGRINIVELSIFPKAIKRFNETPIKIPMTLFYRIRTHIPKNCMEQKRSQIAKATLRENNGGHIMIPDFKLLLPDNSNQNSHLPPGQPWPSSCAIS